jgi:hypothetical protein
MKRLFLFSLVLFFLCVGTTQSQAQEARQNVLKANLLGVGVGGFSLAYERVYADNKSATVTTRFMFYDFKDTKTFTFSGLGEVDVDYGVNMRLIGVLPEARFHLYSLFEKDAPEGLYVAPYIGFTRTKFTVSSLTSAFTIEGGTHVTFLEFGGLLGYQFLIADRITLDFFSGLAFTTFTLESVDIEVASATSFERINDFIKLDKKLPLGATLTGALPRFGASIGFAF